MVSSLPLNFALWLVCFILQAALLGITMYGVRNRAMCAAL